MAAAGGGVDNGEGSSYGSPLDSLHDDDDERDRDSISRSRDGDSSSVGGVEATGNSGGSDAEDRGFDDEEEDTFQIDDVNPPLPRLSSARGSAVASGATAAIAIGSSEPHGSP
jgi:hypothetical protein